MFYRVTQFGYVEESHFSSGPFRYGFKILNCNDDDFAHLLVAMAKLLGGGYDPARWRGAKPRHTVNIAEFQFKSASDAALFKILTA